MKGGRLDVEKGGTLLGTLEVHGTGNTAYLPDGFGFPSLKFVLPAGMGAGGPMLNISARVYGDPAPEIALTDVDISVQTTALNVDDEITLISGAKGITGFSSPTTLNRDGYTFEVREEGGSLIAKVTGVPTYSVSIDPGITDGSITGCNPLTVEHGTTLSITCTATPDAGYILTSLTLTDTTGRTATCNATTCDLTDVRGDVTVSATFTKVPPPGNATAVPTLGGAGLALSSMALAGAAVPVLRRRERRERK